jgi:hypothetical protein
VPSVTGHSGNNQARRGVCGVVLRRALLPFLPLLLLVACGGGDAPDVAATEDDPMAATVDWAARTIEVDLDSPFDVNFCEGDAPLLCVTDDGEQLGVIELATFPGEVDDLDAWAASFYDSVRADRVAACDPGYELVGDDVTEAGGWGRYGFTGSVDEPVERVVGYARNVAGSLQLIVANALVDDGCLSRESELPLDVMDDLEPLLAAIVEGSTT